MDILAYLYQEIIGEHCYVTLAKEENPMLSNPVKILAETNLYDLIAYLNLNVSPVSCIINEVQNFSTEQFDQLTQISAELHITIINV